MKRIVMFVAALAVAVLLGGALGWVQDWGLWKPLRHRGSLLALP